MIIRKNSIDIARIPTKNPYLLRKNDNMSLFFNFFTKDESFNQEMFFFGRLIYMIVFLWNPSQAWAEPLHLSTNKGTFTFNIDIADTDSSRQQGLMDRKTLPADAGMLFVFPKPQHLCFWMKNTLIPLDILFLDPTGLIVDFRTGMIPYSITPICSKVNAIAALEIPGGTIQRLGIQRGDRVDHRLFKE